jgi:hypothetical protein
MLAVQQRLPGPVLWHRHILLEKRGVVKRMHRNRYARRNGSTMALYATFLALVGIPLLALNIDVARVYVGKARLRSATQAACQAYGTMLDYKAFQYDEVWKFKETAMQEAYTAFYLALPSGGSISITATEKSSGLNHIYLVECRGRLIVSALLWVGRSYYNLNQYAQVKVKFATTENWK